MEVISDVLERTGGKKENNKTFSFPSLQAAGEFARFIFGRKDLKIWKVTRFGEWRVYLQ
jgi:hypothetical protein